MSDGYIEVFRLTVGNRVLIVRLHPMAIAVFSFLLGLSVGYEIWR